MLDYLSEQSPPSNEEIKKQLTNIFLNKKEYENYDKDLIKTEINILVDNFPREKLGSLSGYMVFTKKELISKIEKKLL